MKIKTYIYESPECGQDQQTTYSTLLCVKEGTGNTLGILTSCYADSKGRVLLTVRVPRLDRSYLITIEDNSITFEDLDTEKVEERDWRLIMSIGKRDGRPILHPDLRYWWLSEYLQVLFNSLPIDVLSMGEYSVPMINIAQLNAPSIKLAEVELLDQRGCLFDLPRLKGPIHLYDE